MTIIRTVIIFNSLHRLSEVKREVIWQSASAVTEGD